jgi:hypothetical protein
MASTCGTPKPFRNEEHVTPGRSARRRSCSCVSVSGRRTELSLYIPCLVLVWFMIGTRIKSTRTGDAEGVDPDESLADGQRLSCGLAKRLDDIAALCHGCVCIKRATTNERDAMRAGMQEWPGLKVDGEIERSERFSFVTYVSFCIHFHRLVRASVRKSNLICRWRLDMTILVVLFCSGRDAMGWLFGAFALRQHGLVIKSPTEQ